MLIRIFSLLFILLFCCSCPNSKGKITVYVDCLFEISDNECIKPFTKICEKYKIIDKKESIIATDSQNPELIHIKTIYIECKNPQINRKIKL